MRRLLVEKKGISAVLAVLLMVLVTTASSIMFYNYVMGHVESMKKMLDLLVWASWFILGAYSLWFLSKAKTFQPLTLDNLALTWKLHKKEMGCTASRIHSLLVKNNEVVGFKCECGYKFLQKRLITQKVHYAQTSIVPSISSKVAGPLQKRQGSLQNLDIPCLYIKEI